MVAGPGHGGMMRSKLSLMCAPGMMRAHRWGVPVKRRPGAGPAPPTSDGAPWVPSLRSPGLVVTVVRLTGVVQLGGPADPRVTASGSQSIKMMCRRRCRRAPALPVKPSPPGPHRQLVRAAVAWREGPAWHKELQASGGVGPRRRRWLRLQVPCRCFKLSPCTPSQDRAQAGTDTAPRANWNLAACPRVPDGHLTGRPPAAATLRIQLPLASSPRQAPAGPGPAWRLATSTRTSTTHSGSARGRSCHHPSHPPPGRPHHAKLKSRRLLCCAPESPQRRKVTPAARGATETPARPGGPLAVGSPGRGRGPAQAMEVASVVAPGPGPGVVGNLRLP
jgi:hypothetical protein